MQKINSQNAILILDKLKKSLKVSTDIQLSKLLNVKPNTISSWKKRDTLDYSTIISICELYEIDLNGIFFHKELPKKNNVNYSSDTPLICRQVQFQYCLGNDNILDNVPKYNFPFIQGKDTRAFQVVSTNMSPIINENSYVICELGDLKVLPDSSLVVVISRSKGLFIKRIAKNPAKQNTYILGSENKFFNDIIMDAGDIDELWIIKGIFSYNMLDGKASGFKNIPYPKNNIV